MKHRAYGRIERDVMQLELAVSNTSVEVCTSNVAFAIGPISSFNRPDLNIGVKSFVIHILSFTVHLDLRFLCM